MNCTGRLTRTTDGVGNFTDMTYDGAGDELRNVGHGRVAGAKAFPRRPSQVQWNPVG